MSDVQIISYIPFPITEYLSLTNFWNVIAKFSYSLLNNNRISYKTAINVGSVSESFLLLNLAIFCVLLGVYESVKSASLFSLLVCRT